MKRGSRIPTRGKFTGRSTRSTLPTPGRQSPSIPVESTPPTYQFADRQKGAVDAESEDKGKFDESVAENAGAKEPGPNPTDKELPKKPDHKVEKNEPSQRPATTGVSAAARPFQIFWSQELDNTFEEEIFSETNFWTPNALGLFALLEAGHTFIVDNYIRLKHDPSYIDYSVACYYAIIFYVQILRAQMAAGAINGVDSSFLRRFERKYPFESLPIADFLVPFFSTLVSTLLPDLRHTWIVPQYGSRIQAGTSVSNSFLHRTNAAGTGLDRQKFSDFTSKEGTCLLQPIVPYMLAILRSFIDRDTSTRLFFTMAQVYGGAETSTDMAFFNDDDEFVPLNFSSAVASRRFNRTLSAVDGTTNFDNFARLISSPGVNYKFHTNADEATVAWKTWNRSAFGRNINVFAFNATAVNTVKGEDPEFKALEDFLLMPKSSDLNWFEELIKAASTHARYFQGVSNLTDIPTTGGQDPLILATIKRLTGRVTEPRQMIREINRTLSEGWFFNPLTHIGASLRTTRATLEREEELQALTFVPNASVPYVDKTAAITDDDVSVGAVEDVFLVGDYWKDKVYRNASHDQHEHSAKKLFSGWKVLIQNNFSTHRPAGY